MPPKKRRIKKNKKRQFHIALILLLIIAGTFLLYRESGRHEMQEVVPEVVIKPEKKAMRFPEVPKVIMPVITSPRLPRVSIVMDDLGYNKKSAEEVLALKSSLTLSILPHQAYSLWIAEEGRRLGRDIIAHIPMEATRPHKLGEGGIYRDMSGDEIIAVLNKDIQAVPYAVGVSNHMGSAFTRDAQVMDVFIKELKKQGFFFLDSITAPESVGYKLAKKHGVRSIRRDVFLDNSEDPEKIMVQWDRLLKIAKKRGYAVALAHPKKGTLKFLKDMLEGNDKVEVVAISELITE